MQSQVSSEAIPLAAATELKATVARKGLLYDGAFWLALLAGPACSWLFLQLIEAVQGSHAVVLEWRSLLWLIVLYPLVEEWLFRGVVQPYLMRWCWGRTTWRDFTLANGITSLLFALAHFTVRTNGWSLLVLFPSLLFGWFRDRYRSVLPAIFLHATYNFSFFILSSSN